MIPVTRAEITPGTPNDWIDVDVTAHLGGDAGGVAGVMLEIVNTGASAKALGVRNNGSEDAALGYIYAGAHTWIAIGIDSNDIFECKIGDTTDIDVYIVGYIVNSEGAFFTNFHDKSPAEDDWNDIDISAETGGDTAVCAFFLMHNEGSANTMFALRENDSTDDRKRDVMQNRLVGGFVSVDGSEICEGYREWTLDKFYLVGYLTGNFSGWANAKDYSTGTAGSYQEVDMSSDIPAGNDGAFLHFHPTQDTPYDFGIKKNGEAYDSYYDASHHQFVWVEIDSDRKAEQKIENTNLDLWLWGYTSQPEAPAPSAEPAIFFSHNF